MKACVEQNCPNRVVFVCKCKETPAYICENHVASHLKKSGSHNILQLILSLDSIDSDRIVKKVIRNMQFCRDLEQKIQISTKNIINNLFSEASKAIEIIFELKKTYSELIKNLVSAREIDSEEYEKITKTGDFDIAHFPMDTKQIVASINSLFRQNFDKEALWDDDDKYAFFSSGTHLNLLDLETLKIKKEPFYNGKVLGLYGMACKIGVGKYFFYGGSNTACNTFFGNSYTINLLTKTSEDLPSSKAIFLHGGVYKANDIYVFGGCKVFSNPIAECQKYSIPNRKWTGISNLPISSYRVSASLVSDIIFVLGLQLPGIFRYNEATNSFAEEFKMPISSFKYLVANWAFSDKGELYECNSNNKWIQHQTHAEKVYIAWISASFRRAQFIYFIANPKLIFRIDTSLKTLTLVNTS